MKLKAIISGERVRKVDGVPIAILKKAVSEVAEVLWFNGSDYLEKFTSKEIMRRLNAMPEGCEVAVMGGPNHSKRQIPCSTGFKQHGTHCVTLNTDFLY